MGVVGKVGSGKSSLLAAIAAEMRRKDGQVSFCMNYSPLCLCIHLCEVKVKEAYNNAYCIVVLCICTLVTQPVCIQ